MEPRAHILSEDQFMALIEKAAAAAPTISKTASQPAASMVDLKPTSEPASKPAQMLVSSKSASEAASESAVMPVAAPASGVITAEVAVDKIGPLNGKRSVFTGVLAGLTWNDAEEIVKSHGGKVR